MNLKKINLGGKSILKIVTITIYLISILIYEIGICNGQVIRDYFDNGSISFNFSMCRIVLYIIFLILLFKNIDRFLINAIDTLKLKSKKIVIGIYIPIMIITILYVLIRWVSIYKALNLIIILLMGLLFIIYVSSNYIKNTVILTFTLGIMFTFTTDFNHAIDEKKHIMSAANLANGNFNYSKKPLNEPTFNNIIFNCDIDSFIQFYEKKYESNLTDEWNRNEETEIYYMCSSPAEYNFALYIPSSMGILFAKTLGGSIADVYITGRLFNLITYAIMLIIIFKLLPYKQKIFYIIYMLAFTVLLSATYSIDGICIGLIGIFIAYCLNLSERDYKEIKLKQILVLMLLFGLCLLSKNLTYCGMLLLVLVLPIFKILKNNKKDLPIILSLILVATIVGGALVLNKLGATTVDGGDPRGGETSATKQIEFLLSSPTNIIKVGFEHIMHSILNYNWYSYLNNTKFFGEYYSQIFFLELIFILYVCITDNSKKIKLRTSIVSIITFLFVFGSTSLMLYLTFTPVGKINIVGYQPRYLTPLIGIILMLINSKKFIKNTSKEIEEKIDINISLVSGLFIIINLVALVYMI